MTIKSLKAILENILDQVYVLKNKYISEPLKDIDYVGVAFSNIDKQQELVTFLEKQGSKIVYSDDWGNVYRLPFMLDTKYGELDLVKVSYVDGKKDRKSYADFKIDKNTYSQLNQKYKGKSIFVSMYGEGWEILGIKDPSSEVSLFIPNIPLSYDVRDK